MNTLAASLVALCLLAGDGKASSEPRKPVAAKPKAQATKPKEARDARSSKRAADRRPAIRLEALQVEGRIQKPQAFYILQRGNLTFEELNRSESFLPKVVKSVDKAPF